jgi:hypothetical protein
MDTITGMADTITDIRTRIHTATGILMTTRTITDIHTDILTTTHTTIRMDTIIHTQMGTHTDTIMPPPRLRIPTTTADILTTTTTICTAFSYTSPQTPVARWPSFSQLP